MYHNKLTDLLHMLNTELLTKIEHLRAIPKKSQVGHGFYEGDAAIVYDFHASTVLKKDIYRVVEGFTFMSKTGIVVHVPAGYLTDGASVPKIFQSVINPWGRHGRAAIIHDILCDFATAYTREGMAVRTSDRVVNDIFLEAMEIDQVKKLKKKLIITSVKVYFRYFRKEVPERPTLELDQLENLYKNRIAA